MKKKIAIVLFALAAVLAVASMVMFHIYDAKPFDVSNFWIAYTASDLLLIAPFPAFAGIWLLFSPMKIHVACFASSLLCAVSACSLFYFGLSHPELTGPQFIGVICWAIIIACPVLLVVGILACFLDFKFIVNRKNGMDIKLSIKTKKEAK